MEGFGNKLSPLHFLMSVMVVLASKWLTLKFLQSSIVLTLSDSGINSFGTDFQFYVGILSVSGKTLTITYDPHNSQYTYTGTVSAVTLAGGAVLDLGTVELVKTTTN